MIGFMVVEQGVEGVEEAKLAVEHTKKSDFLPFLSPFPLSGLSCIDSYCKFGVSRFTRPPSL
jgi:hypothetical protein